jgi:hypothetical protein
VSLLYVAVAGATIVANAAVAIGGAARADFVVKNAEEVGVPRSWVPTLAALKAAGAIGILLGILGVPVIGTAAAAGLALFFIVAVSAHVRAHVLYNIAFPGFYLALAVASLILSLHAAPL